MKPTRVLARALAHMWPFRGRFLTKLAIVLLGLVPVLLLPWPTKILIDHVIVGTPFGALPRPYPFFVRWFTDWLPEHDPMGILWWTVVAQGVLLVLVGAFGTTSPENSYADTSLASGGDTATTTENAANAGWSAHGGLVGLLETWFTMRLTQDLNHRFRCDLFARLLATPMPALADTQLGDAVYRVMYDTPAITNACYRLVLTPIVAPIGLALTAGAIELAFGDLPELILAALAFLPLSFLVTWPFVTALRRAATESRVAGARATAKLSEALARVPAIQGLDAGTGERQRFDRMSWAGFTSHRRMLLLGGGAALVATFAGFGLALYTFLHIADLVIAGRISVGDFALLFAYFAQVVFYVVELGTCWIRLQTSAAGLGRVFDALDAPAEHVPAAAVDAPVAPERIRFEQVGFDHAGAPVLCDVSCELRRGELVALVGPAGAGKTTFASLVPGFLVATAGRVLVDGRDVTELRAASLRARVGFVFQEPGLLQGTIADNIRLGDPDASDLEVRRAAMLAGADEFVRALPAGYATAVGRGGAKLSVGQRSRVAIARAFLRDAPILILDEPTAALDPASERRLVARLRELAPSRIVLVISHRLAIAQAADRVLVLEDGRLVEDGAPRDLLARPRGAYRRYVELQQLGTA
ncbi:MAG TPA: ABC transporter ATP-binding protein [Candidatus Eisenbacteria bacterium]|nr:ABC transporter ATP-binding protein [Candidatus Eisenbacteria bacterium]